LYGVLANAVAARRREFGVRAAIGAGPARIVTSVMRGGLLPVGVGLVAGLAAAVAVSGALRHQLYALERFDPLVYAGTLVVLLLTAMLASFAPAWRASRVSPAEVLRDE
jgi:putative ABC transport system permease protein